MLFFKNSCENLAKSNRMVFAATGCGFYLQLQRYLGVGFLHHSDADSCVAATHFGGDVLLALGETGSILRTVIMSVFGSRVPTIFTFNPALGSANSCLSNL